MLALLKKIETFFFKLTSRNWGAPYHLIIAWLATDLSSFFVNAWLAGGAVLFVGLLYERFQFFRKNNSLREFNEDMAANLIGVILGMLL